MKQTGTENETRKFENQKTLLKIGWASKQILLAKSK